MSRCTGVILAAGTGERFGGSTPKQLEVVAGRPVLAWSVQAFEHARRVNDVIVVTREDLVGAVADIVGASAATTKVRAVVVGGATRQASTQAALAWLADEPDEHHVLVHDAARPLIRPEDIDAVDLALDRHRAAGLATPTTDTIWAVVDGVIGAVPDRTRLWRAQTPQGFHLGVGRAAHAAAAADQERIATDDCGLVARYVPEVDIAVVPGPPTNLKVTTPDDLCVAETLLAAHPEVTEGSR